MNIEKKENKISNTKKKISNIFIMKNQKTIFKTSYKIPVIKNTKLPLKIKKSFTEKYLNIKESNGFNEYSTIHKYVTFKKITKIIHEDGEDIEKIIGYENISEAKYQYKNIGIENNWGIITGSPNKIYVLDLDSYKDNWKTLGNEHPFIKHYHTHYKFELDNNYITNIEKIIKLINTFSVKTASGGYHLYFNYNTNTNLARKCAPNFEVDFLGEGGFCMGYNSILNNKKYEVINDVEIKYFNEIHEDFYNILITHELEPKQKKNKLKKLNEHKAQKNHKMNMSLWNYDLNDETYNEILIGIKYYQNRYFQGKDKNYCYDNFLKITTFFKFFNKKDDWINFCKIDKNFINYKENNEIMWKNIDIEEVQNKYQPKCIVSMILIDIKKYHLLSNIKYRKLISNIIEPDIVVDSTGKKGISEVLQIESNKNYIIKSKTNTGKTYLFNKYIHNKQEKPILSIVSRVSLAIEHQRVFEMMNSEEKDTSFLLYNDPNLHKNFNNYENENMIIQLDSLLKIQNWDFSNYIVFIDEFQSLYEYLDLSPTLKHKKRQLDALLLKILGDCHQFIFVDADIMDSSLEFIKDKTYPEIAINRDFIFIENIYSPYKNVKSEEIYDYEKFVEQISKDDCFMVCTDSSTEAHNLKTYLLEKHAEKFVDKKIVIIDRLYDKQNTMNLDEIYFLIFSPSIIYGLDSLMSRNVYALYKGHTINSKAMLQQISRCRNPKKIFFHFMNKENIVNNFEFNSENEVIERVKYLSNYCNKFSNLDIKDNIICSIEKSFNSRIEKHLYNIDSDQTNKYIHFINGLKNMDIEIVTNGVKKNIKLEKNKANKIKKATLQEYEEHFLENKDSEYYKNINDILKIDDENKEKFKEMFINPFALQKHLNYINFFKKSSEKSIQQIKDLMENNYNINITLCDENKILWLKEKLTELDFDYKTLLFKKDLKNPKKCFEEYCKLFRNQSIKSFDDKNLFTKAIKTAFDQLFNLNLKDNIFLGKAKQKMVDGVRYRYTEYSLNQNIYDFHMELLNFRKQKDEYVDCLID